MTHVGVVKNYVQLLKISMTYLFGHVLAGPSHFEHVFANTLLPQVAIKPCLDMTSFGNLLLLFIDMTLAGCGLKLWTVNKHSNDIPSWACTCTCPPPHFLNMLMHVPPLLVNQTLSRHDVNWQHTVTIINDDSCKMWLKTMYCY